MHIRRNWFYLNWRKYLYIDISNPKKTLNKLKGIFKPLECYFECTFDEWTPYPVLWVSKPAFIQIMSHDVGWKDKYDTPRFEVPSYIWIHIYKLNLVWYWGLSNSYLVFNPKLDLEDYWEQALWYLYYYNNTSYGCDKPDLEKAKESWPWEDYHTKKSTWKDEFLFK